MGVGQGQGPLFWEFNSFFLWVQTFLVFFWKICEITCSAIAAWGLAADQSLGSEKKIIVCIALFCIFCYCCCYFFVLLSCLCLNPRVLLFFILLPIPLGREERVSGCMVLVSSCQVKPWQFPRNYSRAIPWKLLWRNEWFLYKTRLEMTVIRNISEPHEPFA